MIRRLRPLVVALLFVPTAQHSPTIFPNTTKTPGGLIRAERPSTIRPAAAVHDQWERFPMTKQLKLACRTRLAQMCRWMDAITVDLFCPHDYSLVHVGTSPKERKLRKMLSIRATG